MGVLLASTILRAAVLADGFSPLGAPVAGFGAPGSPFPARFLGPRRPVARPAFRGPFRAQVDPLRLSLSSPASWVCPSRRPLPPPLWGPGGSPPAAGGFRRRATCAVTSETPPAPSWLYPPYFPTTPSGFGAPQARSYQPRVGPSRPSFREGPPHHSRSSSNGRCAVRAPSVFGKWPRRRASVRASTHPMTFVARQPPNTPTGGSQETR